MTAGTPISVLLTLTMAIGWSMDTRTAPLTTWEPTSITTGKTSMVLPCFIFTQVAPRSRTIPTVNLLTEMAAMA